MEQPLNALALVMGGGGARAAYQVGLLRFLAARLPRLEIPILTGVSAGAINTVKLASAPGDFVDGVRQLEDLWRRLSIDQVFRVGAPGLVRNALRWGLRLVAGGSRAAPVARGLVDTAPLQRFLASALYGDADAPAFRPLAGIAHNLDRGKLRAVAVTTTNYATGQSITWVEGRDVALWERPQRRALRAAIDLRHVMASAALPVMFPAVQIDEAWHGDGGIRLTAPLSPAMQLGASRIIAVSTRYQRRQDEANQLLVTGYPPLAQVAGVLMNAIFLDMLDYDAMILSRINELLIKIRPEERGSLRPVELLVVRPSVDLGKLSAQYEATLPGPFRFFTRGLGTRETRSPDYLSMLMFNKEYIQQLIAIGEADAERRADEILAFVSR
ncbi:MAG: patatin-like phospholipase family protein [Planctomycetota bacterium]